MATVTQQTTARLSREETEPQSSGGSVPPGPALPRGSAPASVPARPKAGPRLSIPKGSLLVVRELKRKEKKNNSVSKKCGRHQVK